MSDYVTARITTLRVPVPEIDRALPNGALIEQRKFFEIIEPLGEGGMGKVYKAYDPTMDRYVALKVLKPDVPETERARFQREAVIAANFSHPNLVRVLEVGQSGELHWLAMEYLRGRDVGRVIENRKTIAFRVLIDIFVQTLDALQYVHTRGIAHCDIKPENIFVTRDPYDRQLVQIKLIDFGIARSLEGPLELHTHLTGDPRYMAPEQAIMNKKIDGRADLYALGMAFFEVLARRHPFEEYFQVLDPLALLALQTTHPLPSLATWLPEGTPESLAGRLDQFMVRACAKHADDRFTSALDMQQEMLSLLSVLE